MKRSESRDNKRCDIVSEAWHGHPHGHIARRDRHSGRTSGRGSAAGIGLDWPGDEPSETERQQCDPLKQTSSTRPLSLSGQRRARRTATHPR